ncbi:hypothetical protein [Roseomonas sp. 18066]|uniref:hypothetical protein n=1 Tax=Roseomonas sp. 18066 TaxID=2681412 RepID=UPI001356A131|nr:hypothetical protein [Roseomonas sp. 18066]
MFVTWSGLGFLSVFFLVGGMAAGTLGLRPWFAENMPFQEAVYLANAFGLMLGALVNLGAWKLLTRRGEDNHSLLGLGMRGWSMMGLLGAGALATYAMSLSAG